MMTEQMAPHSEQVRQLFDAKAPEWSAKYEPDGRLTGRLASLAEAVRGQFPPGSTVLDLGCGTGELARALAEMRMQVTACDISVEMLRRAVESDHAGSVEWAQLGTAWRTLPLRSSAFDAVIASSVLEYVEDPVSILGECARVLRPGGTVLCTVPDTRHWIRRIERLARVLSHVPGVQLVSRSRPQLARYILYLHISRQRHAERWWHAAATEAGLRPAPAAAGWQGRSTLRLLVFEHSQASSVEDT